MNTETDFFASAKKRVEAAQSIRDLETVARDLLETIRQSEDDVAAKIAKFSPLAALASVPAADPQEICGWISRFIEGYLAPQVHVATGYVLQQEALAVQRGDLISTIEKRTEDLKTSVMAQIT